MLASAHVSERVPHDLHSRNSKVHTTIFMERWLSLKKWLRGMTTQIYLTNLFQTFSPLTGLNLYLPGNFGFHSRYVLSANSKIFQSFWKVYETDKLSSHYLTLTLASAVRVIESVLPVYPSVRLLAVWRINCLTYEHEMLSATGRTTLRVCNLWAPPAITGCGMYANAGAFSFL